MKVVVSTTVVGARATGWGTLTTGDGAAQQQVVGCAQQRIVACTTEVVAGTTDGLGHMSQRRVGARYHRGWGSTMAGWEVHSKRLWLVQQEVEVAQQILL